MCLLPGILAVALLSWVFPLGWDPTSLTGAPHGWATPLLVLVSVLAFVWAAFFFWTILNVISDSLTAHPDVSPMSSIGRVFLELNVFAFPQSNHLRASANPGGVPCL